MSEVIGSINEVEDVEPVEAPEVDVPDASDEVEDVSVPAEADASEKAPKEPAKPKRGDLPEGYITPVGFAHLLSAPKDGDKDNLTNDNWHYTNGKDGSHTVPPQMVYSYLKNNKAITTYTIEDSNGQSRENILKTDEAWAWWTGRSAKAAERAANAKAKLEAAAAKANAAPEATTPSSEPEAEVVEAE